MSAPPTQGRPAPYKTLVRIEQAIARGETLDQICDGLNVEPQLVDRVLRRMDDAVNGPPPRQPRSKPPAAVSLTKTRALRPHGTHAAHERHRAHGQQPCTKCVIGELAFHRQRRQQVAS